MDAQHLIAEGLVPSPGKRVQRPGLHTLTGLRFFAAFYVMMFHFGAGFTARAHLPRFVTTFLEHGHLGVALFFMLSGFVLYYSYKDNVRTPRDVYGFFVARIARLYPVYLLAIVVAAILDMQLPHGKILLIFPMLQAWTPAVSYDGYAWVVQAWTLSIEAFFYCSFPFLLMLFRRKWSTLSLSIAAALIALVAICVRAPFLHPGVEPTWIRTHTLLPLLCLPEFLFGILLCAIFMQKQEATPTTFTNDWITLAGILPCLGLIAFYPGEYVLSLAVVCGFGWTIYRFANGRGWLTNLLSSRLMMLLGGASFSIYLLQSLVRTVCRRTLGILHPGLDGALAPVILVVLSCLIFLYYEEPLRSVIRNLLTSRASAKSATQAQTT